jgi:hypothetical protein
VSVTPSGKLSLPVTNLRSLLAACTAFQQWVGADDEEDPADVLAAAAARIHLWQMDEDDSDAGRVAARPFAVIGCGDGWSGEPQDSGGYFHSEPDLELILEEMASNESGPATAENSVSTTDALLHLSNAAGAIIEEMEAKSQAGGYLNITSWQIVQRPARMALADVKKGEPDVATMTIRIKVGDL